MNPQLSRLVGTNPKIGRAEDNRRSSGAPILLAGFLVVHMRERTRRNNSAVQRRPRRAPASGRAKWEQTMMRSLPSAVHARRMSSYAVIRDAQVRCPSVLKLDPRDR